MDNPFLRRATEFLRDDEAFLAIVSPDPVTQFLKKPGKEGTLYDRLVLLRGTPGSGKTTLAKLFEYPTLSALLRNSEISTYQALVAALTECGAIENDLPTVLGCRLALDTDYRDFWQFPYSDNLKLGLMTGLIQARTVLGWLRHLKSVGIEPDSVQIVPRADAEAIVDAIGGTRGSDILARARSVETALYQVLGALIAPSEAEISRSATSAYHPFDIIEYIAVPDPRGTGQALHLRPLAIFDDAHALHPAQFTALNHWLAHRSLRICRWLIARFDALQPQEALASIVDDRPDAVSYPGLKADREIETILLQSVGPRREQRTQFRKMAKDMASRYLRKYDLLSSKNLVSLGDLLRNDLTPISASKLAQLESKIAGVQKKLRVSEARKQTLWKEVEDFRTAGQPVPKDVGLAMLSILMHRYDKRRGQPSMFESDDDPEPSKPVAANASVLEAARLQLMHEFDQAFYYGIDDLCDASCENAEQFLQLAGALVETIATQVIREKGASLDPRMQHKLLRQRGERIIEGWNFPHHIQVRCLVTQIAEKCVTTTLQPNGWLTPNAFGIRQDEFGSLTASQPDLARVLQFAVAYNAVTLVPHYPCKDKEWCLLELGGMVILKHGLTLKRGGFLEGTTQQLLAMLQENPK
jgi:hypothetical protein